MAVRIRWNTSDPEMTVSGIFSKTLTQPCPGRTSPVCHHMSAFRYVCSAPAWFQPSVWSEYQDALQSRTVKNTLYSQTFRTRLPEIEKPVPQNRRRQSGMWYRSLDSSQRVWFLDGFPFLCFSNLLCNPRSRSARFHFSSCIPLYSRRSSSGICLCHHPKILYVRDS